MIYGIVQRFLIVSSNTYFKYSIDNFSCSMYPCKSSVGLCNIWNNGGDHNRFFWVGKLPVIWYFIDELRYLNSKLIMMNIIALVLCAIRGLVLRWYFTFCFSEQSVSCAQLTYPFLVVNIQAQYLWQLDQTTTRQITSHLWPIILSPAIY